MAYPWELIRRAQANRRQPRPLVRQENHTVAEQRELPVPETWQTRHGAYDRLMRSHDRVHTRHLGG